jgi:hypothetical protein
MGSVKVIFRIGAQHLRGMNAAAPKGPAAVSPTNISKNFRPAVPRRAATVTLIMEYLIILVIFSALLSIIYSAVVLFRYY